MELLWRLRDHIKHLRIIWLIQALNIPLIIIIINKKYTYTQAFFLGVWEDLTDNILLYLHGHS